MGYQETIGDYTVFDRIAAGGMAEILLGRRNGPMGFKKTLVIKRLLPEFAQDPTFTKMFLDEARLAARLNHPNIIQIYDLGQADSSFYIAMEYLVGENLATLLDVLNKKNRRLPVSLAVKIIIDVANALSYAHTLPDSDGMPLGVVHRDVSPQNVVLTAQGFVKVIDFGIAKAACHESTTQLGVIKGKLSYMAPEQLEGEEVDHRADIYMLGVTFFEALTGHCPYKAESRKGADMLPNLRSIDGDLDERLEDVIVKATALNPGERYQAVRDLSRDLDEYVLTSRPADSSSHLADLMLSTFGYGHFQAMEQRMHPVSTAAKELIKSTSESVTPGPHSVGPTRTLRVISAYFARNQSPSAEPVGSAPRIASESSLSMRRIVTGLIGSPKSAMVFLFVLLGLAAAGYGGWVYSVSSPSVAVTITSEPSGAEVFLGDRNMGQTPTVVRNVLLQREYQFRISKPGYETQQTSFRPTANAAVHGVHVVLEKDELTTSGASPVQAARTAGSDQVGHTRLAAKNVGYLTVRGPVPLRVQTGSELLGTTPLLKVPLRAGKTTLRLSNPEELIYKDVSLTITPNRITEYIVAWKKGTLSVEADPWAVVYIGSRELGKTPLYDVALWEGSYTVVLRNPEINVEQELRVTIEPDRSTRLHPKLQ